jgi:hypothetical protein
VILCPFLPEFLDATHKMKKKGSPPNLFPLQNTHSPDKVLRCYAMAALANAALHPLLAGRLRELDGPAVIDRETKGLGLGGTRIIECAEAALARLGEGAGDGGSKEGGAAAAAGVGSGAVMLGLGARRWTFK